jgi:hypothetical protein
VIISGFIRFLPTKTIKLKFYKIQKVKSEYVANTPTTKICSEYQQEDRLTTLEKIIGKLFTKTC